MGSKRLSVTLLILFLGTGAVAAQSFNVDFGDAFGTPADSFGAAVGQAGHWNSITGLEEEPPRLVDVRGNLTGVVLAFSLPFGQAQFDHPGTTGDDQALLDDYLDLHSVPATLEIRGLQAGAYALYTYAWAPDEPAFRTVVGVDGHRTEIIGGEWTGTYVEGVTHAIHIVGAAPDRPVIISLFGLGKGTLNGLQIVRIGMGS
jgi:hypothetical protein